mmetsp:Transcript_9666/g.10847  ORF Transcript_9666/g.10847 Transcript_9666/m.10847 type:complete len:263 (-) Transcript_9666:327-1115(-)
MMQVFDLLLSILLFLPVTTLFACQVTINDQDVTTDYLIFDSIVGESYVNCMGHSKCRDALIVECGVIKCFENEACSSAKIINFTDSVLCEGLHACHRTEILAAPAHNAATTYRKKSSVSCIGSGSCDVAQITGAEEVVFSGVKAGRKTHVQGSKLVKCHDGTENAPACEGLTSMETECLYCGKHGCADHINMCRYKIIDGEDNNDNDNDNNMNQFEKCQPDKIMGNCPAEMDKELQLELNGKEELDVIRDGGTRRMRGSRMF